MADKDTASATDKEGPRERVEGFIARRRQDVGEFVRMDQLSDGYIAVQFEKATFYTPKNDRVVYRGGTGYERPPLRNTNGRQ